jgi:general stress protein 26
MRQSNLLQDRCQHRRMPARCLGRLRVKHETQRYDSHWNTDSNHSFDGSHNPPLYRLLAAFRKF